MNEVPKPVVWPADQIERRATAALVPYARNARTHSEEQVGQIAASIREWGWTVPVLIDEADGIIAGHCRVLAAARLGIGEIPVMVARGWSEARKKAYVIADNKLTDNGGWDQALLKIELEDLASMGFDLPLMGFSDSELAGLMRSNPGLTDPDEAPEPPAEPVSKLGDVWVLGRHRLVCGDATKVEDVEKALNGVKPHLLVSDPPYGVEYDAKWRDKALGGKAGGRATGAVNNDDKSDWREAWALFPGDVAYVWHAGVHAAQVEESLRVADFEPRAQIIWAKSHFAIGRGDYHVQHEPCFYLVRKGKAGHWASDRKQTTLWPIDKPVKSETGHSAQKPVECMQRPIENNSSPGQAVYDPFLGSGTTIIAGEMIGRHIHAIELSPAYVDVAVIRWQNFTGEPAVDEKTGRTFAEVAAGRKEGADAAA